MDTTYKNPNENYFDLGQGGNPITMDSLTPKTPINLTPAPQDTTNYQAVMGSVPDYTDILKGMQATTPQETAVNQERGRLQKITDYILGRGGSVGSDGQINTDIAKNNALETNIKNFGYSDSGDAYKQLTEVNSQINALRKEALAIPLQVQNELTGRASVSGMQGQSEMRLRQNAIKSLGLASIAETIQGNISTASSLAERAVNMEFAPLQAELNAFRQNYELNKDALERADKKKAQQLEFTLKERERVLNDQMADKKTILGFVAEGAKNGAPTLLLDRARQSNNPMEVLSILGQYMSDPIAKEQALTDLALTRANIARINADISKTDAEKRKILSDAQVSGTTTKQQLQNNEALTLAKELRQSDAVGKKGAVGFAFQKFIPYGQAIGLQPDRASFEAKVNTLKSNLTLDNLKLLKGSMSDKDLLFLNSIGSSLNTDMSETEFDKELDRVISKLESAGATAGSTEQTGTLQDGTVVTRGADGKIRDAQGNLYDENGNRI